MKRTVFKRTTWTRAVVVLPAAAFVLASGCAGSTVTFVISRGNRALAVEVARLPAVRSKGLTGGKSLPSDSGMLFDFGGNVEVSFWMKDTSIPLSIAFIERDGTVLSIRDMRPYDLSAVEPGGEYRYAVEANRGWFERNGVKPGDRAKLDI